MAAQRTFLGRRYDGTRVADIASSARVTPATFYRYFASKDAVSEVVVQQAADVAASRLRRVTTKADPLQRLVLLVRAHVWQFRRNARVFDVDQQPRERR